MVIRGTAGLKKYTLEDAQIHLSLVAANAIKTNTEIKQTGDNETISNH